MYVKNKFLDFLNSLIDRILINGLWFVLAQCSMTQNILTTFNNKQYKNEMPASCYQVLAQDCTPDLKFMVLLKKDEFAEQNHMNVKIADL